jgi:hypothetical protein
LGFSTTRRFHCCLGCFRHDHIRPFDNWWHNAYGLDVAILSPPHVLLMTGSVAISISSLILIGGAMNRSEGRQRTMLRGLFL